MPSSQALPQASAHVRRVEARDHRLGDVAAGCQLVTARRLPRSLEDLRGLRSARWTRESTAGQVDNFGPDAQREQQDRAISRYGLTDTGISWSVAHSGRTIATTE